jgi:molecular chaperone GrpE
MSDEDTSADDGDPPPGDGGQMSADELLGEIREYDETLADDVRRIIERGAELHDAAGELERTLEQRNAEIVELEAALDERDDRIEELRDRLEAQEAGSGDDEATEDGASNADDGTTEDGETAPGNDEATDTDETGTDDETTAGDGDDDRIAELRERLDEREETVADLQERLDDREEEIEELTNKLRHKQADFENYKKRAERKRERIRERATEDLVERLLDVRDNLKRAIEGDHDDVESLTEGVEMTLREFDRVLEDENVTEIAPDPGDEIDPQEHEVMMRVDSDQPADTVADLYTPGYRMAEKVIRPAQVTVSTGPAEEEANETASDEGSADDAATATAPDGDE